MIRALCVAALLTALATGAASANINSQSDGSDGVLNVTSTDLTIDLSRAATGPWTQPGTGTGVYDSTKWAVVFKYSSVNIASGRTVRFTNHPSGAPVVWLVQGTATIAGSVALDGEHGHLTNREAMPGPGGFPGGRGTFPGSPATFGHGPGGAPTGTNAASTNSGAYATVPSGSAGVTYGNPSILPLIGGSGGAGSANAGLSAGAGGGALLLVAGQRVLLNGGLYARGGSYSSGGSNASGEGSGGAVRVVTDTLAGSGVLHAVGWSGNFGGHGRIRLECNTLTFTTQTSPAYSLLLPLGSDPVIWPPAPEPIVRITSVNGIPVTGDPSNNAQALVSGNVTINNASLVPVTLAASNVPTNATITVRVVLGFGSGYVSAPATLVSGDGISSTWSVTLPAVSPGRVSSLQARVVLP